VWEAGKKLWRVGGSVAAMVEERSPRRSGLLIRGIGGGGQEGERRSARLENDGGRESQWI